MSLTTAAVDDAVLDQSIRYRRASDLSPHSARVGLLTGATGFLGVNLLHDLLTRTPLEIVCLVRASGDTQAMARVRASLVAHECWRDDFVSRMHAVAGDISKPGLGLSGKQLQDLAASVHVIYHNAAKVNFVFPYRVLKADNVTGTLEMLRFAALGSAKTFHFISSIAAFGAGPGIGPVEIREEFQIPSPLPSASGYAQSKWVAERLVNAAAERGLAASIYRPGRISGHSQTGVCSAEDTLSLLMRWSAHLGVAPQLDSTIHLTPVDFVSRAVVEISHRCCSHGRAFHLYNPAAVSWEHLVSLMQEAGSVQGSIPYDKWCHLLAQRKSLHQEDGISSLLALLAGRSRPFSTSRIVAQENTAAALRSVGMSYPSNLNSLLRLYVRFIISTCVAGQAANGSLSHCNR